MTFPKGKDNYPPTVERAVHLLNTYKIKFDYTKKGVNIMSDEEEVTFIECVRVEEGNYMFPLQQEGTHQRRLPQEQEE